MTIPIRTPEEATTFPEAVAGGGVYQDTAEFHSHGGLLCCNAGVTAQGVSAAAPPSSRQASRLSTG